jgi:hypothetical protein
MAAGRSAPQPGFRLGGIELHALAATIEFSQVKHRRRLPRLRGLAKQNTRPRYVVSDVLAVQQQQCQAEFGGRIVESSCVFKPRNRPLVRPRLPVAAGV